ncbi:MAG: PIG-L deacetylase family protein [Dehalococcoidales bacterium]
MAVKPAQVIVFAPHPDDAEIGAGGTITRWVREGKDVILVICTNGDKGTSDPKIKPEELAKTRKKETLAGAKVMGVREVIFLNQPDQGVEDTPELRKEFVRLIRKYRPDAVATTDPYRRYLSHRDHRKTGQVVLDAVFPYARDLYAYPDLLEAGFEPHKVTEVYLWGSEDANYRSDITDTFGIKIEAIGCHESQFGTPTPERTERMRERAKANAEGVDYELAESFHRIQRQR